MRNFNQIFKFIVFIMIIFLLTSSCKTVDEQEESTSIIGTWRLLRYIVSDVETTSPFTNSSINWDSGPRNDTIKWTEFLVFTQTNFNDYIYVESYNGDGENGPVEQYYYYYCSSEVDSYYLKDETIVVGEWEAQFKCGNNELQIYFPGDIIAVYKRETELGQTKDKFCRQIIRLLDF